MLKRILKNQMNQVNRNFMYSIINLNFVVLGPEIYEMEELEEHLRAVNEQVKIRRKLLKDFTENNHSVRYSVRSISKNSYLFNQISHTDLSMYEKEIEQTNIIIANKRRIYTKLEDEIEQYHIKIDRADQLVCINKNLNLRFLSV